MLRSSSRTVRPLVQAIHSSRLHRHVIHHSINRSINPSNNLSIKQSFNQLRSFSSSTNQSKRPPIDPRDRLPAPGFVFRFLIRRLNGYLKSAHNNNAIDAEFRAQFDHIWSQVRDNVNQYYPKLPKETPVDWTTGEFLSEQVFRTSEEEQQLENELRAHMKSVDQDVLNAMIQGVKLKTPKLTADKLTLPVYKAQLTSSNNQSIKPRSFGIRLPSEMAAIITDHQSIHHLSFVEAWTLSGQTEDEFTEGLKYAFSAANQAINRSINHQVTLKDDGSIDQLPASISAMFYGGYARYQLQHLMHFRSIKQSNNKSTTSGPKPATTTTETSTPVDHSNSMKVPQLDMTIDGVKILSSTINAYLPLTIKPKQLNNQSNNQSIEHFELFKIERALGDPPLMLAFHNATPPAVVLQVTAVFGTTEKISFVDQSNNQPINQSIDQSLVRFAKTSVSQNAKYESEWSTIHSGTPYKRQHVVTFAAELTQKQYATILTINQSKTQSIMSFYLPLADLLGDLGILEQEISVPIKMFSTPRFKADGSVYGIPNQSINQFHRQKKSKQPFTVKEKLPTLDLQWKIRSINQPINSAIRETKEGGVIEVKDQELDTWFINQTPERFRDSMKLDIKLID